MKTRTQCVAYVVFAAWLILSVWPTRTMGQPAPILEDFEYATSDEAAAAAVTDISDAENQPVEFDSGDDDDASPQEPGGLFSMGTDAVFCINFQLPCIPGTFIGFRRHVDEERFPMTCQGDQHYAPLKYTYGDPDVPGDPPADFPLSELQLLWDVYGDGPFGGGPDGTHLWLRLVDCEGEKFEYVNLSEPSLFIKVFTFDVLMGKDIIRIAPESLIDVPNGDRLLTEIAALEVLIQDTDNPPTTFGKWYVDYLRYIEPEGVDVVGDGNGDGEVNLVDWSLFANCMRGPRRNIPQACMPFDFEPNNRVDLLDAAMLQRILGGD